MSRQKNLLAFAIMIRVAFIRMLSIPVSAASMARIAWSGIWNMQCGPGATCPRGLPRQRLAVLSPIWRGPVLTLEYPDGEVHTLKGWSGEAPGAPFDLRVFWTRPEPTAPATALAIGGDAGVRLFAPGAADNAAQGFPFLALAPSMIPAAVLNVIGPPPEPEPVPPLLLV
jgi:hypothetical protein